MRLLQLFLPTAQTDSSHWTLASIKQPKNFFAASFKNVTQNKSADSYKDSEIASQPVDLQMGIMKPLGGKWMISLYDYMKSKPDITKNGFHHAGLTNY